MSRVYTRAAWAGVVVKLTDGTTYAFEIPNPTKAEVVIEHDYPDVPFGHVGPVLPGASHVHIEIDGWGANSARFAHMADDVHPQGEIEARRVLPAGPS